MSFYSNLREVLAEGRAEYSDATIAKKMSLWGVVTSLAFEWGTGNEALIGYMGGRVLGATHNTVLTAAATGMTSFVEQSVFGLVAVAGVHNFPNFMQSLNSRLFGAKQAAEDTAQKESTTTAHESDNSRFSTRKSCLTRMAGRFITAFNLGTSVKLIANNAQESRSTQENIRNVIGDAALIAAGIVTVATSVSAATNIGRSVQGLEQPAELFVNVVSNPLTYLGLFGLKIAADMRHTHGSELT